jgi:hypothetical protein
MATYLSSRAASRKADSMDDDIPAYLDKTFPVGLES